MYLDIYRYVFIVGHEQLQTCFYATPSFMLN